MQIKIFYGLTFCLVNFFIPNVISARGSVKLSKKIDAVAKIAIERETCEKAIATDNRSQVRISLEKIQQSMAPSEFVVYLQDLLMLAACHNAAAVATYLIVHHKIDVDCETEDLAETPFMLATYAGNNKVAEVLHAHKAYVKHISAGGVTPLHAAAISNAKAIAKMILKEYKDGIQDLAYNDKTDADCETPLHFAAYFGSYEVASLLKDLGADLAAKNCDGKTPHDVAVAQGHEHLAHLLAVE